MASKSKTPGTGDAEGSEIVLLGSLNIFQNSLSERRAQYLADTFNVPPDTARLLTSLAFGEVQ